MGDSETRAIKRRNAKSTGRAAVAFQRFIRRLVDGTDGGALGLERSTGIARANFQNWKDKPKPTLPAGENLVILSERLGYPIESFLGLVEEATERSKGVSVPQATRDSLAVALAKHVYEHFLIRHRGHQPHVDGILHVLDLRPTYRKLGWKPKYRVDGALIPDFSEADRFLKRITNEAIDEANDLEQFAAARKREALLVEIRELGRRLTSLGTDAASVLLTEAAATQLLLSAAVSLDEAVMRESIRRVNEALDSLDSSASNVPETAEDRDRALAHEHDPLTKVERANSHVALEEVASLSASRARVAQSAARVARLDAFERALDTREKHVEKREREGRIKAEQIERDRKAQEHRALFTSEKARTAEKKRLASAARPSDPRTLS